MFVYCNKCIMDLTVNHQRTSWSMTLFQLPQNSNPPTMHLHFRTANPQGQK